MHKSGFVNIVGRPNVGKSTLMNVLVGERLSVITSKPQTTRHRILGIINEDDYQIVFSDSPGMIDDPAYKMQAAMNQFAYSSFEDADIVLFVTDPEEKLRLHPRLEQNLRNTRVPKIWVLNKIDLLQNDEANTFVESCKKLDLFDEYFLISALQNTGIEPLFQKIIELLPEGPEYYPKDQLTDKPERFFVSEMIRGKILELYYQEIPYSVEVVVDEFKEEDLNGKELVKIYAVIFVARQSQKGIIIGKGGSAIKQLGIESRKQIEEFLGKQIFLELYVKVKENWRDKEYFLKQFGYH